MTLLYKFHAERLLLAEKMDLLNDRLGGALQQWVLDDRFAPPRMVVKTGLPLAETRRRS